MNLFSMHLFWPLLAYLIGSIPFGLIIVRSVARIDIREQGSGNIGATNVWRTVGSGWAAAVLAGDLLKGLLPVVGALFLMDTNLPWLPAMTALAAIAGHTYPAYLKFKPSGKGVATTLGAFVAMTPLAILIALLAFVLVVYKFRHVALGSLAAAIALPPGIWFTKHDPVLTACALIVMVLIVWRHADNLRRLARGVEPSLDELHETEPRDQRA